MRGSDASVPAMTVTAAHTAERFKAVASLTVTPDAVGAPPNSAARALSCDEYGPSQYERIASASRPMSRSPAREEYPGHDHFHPSHDHRDGRTDQPHADRQDHGAEGDQAVGQVLVSHAGPEIV